MPQIAFESPSGDDSLLLWSIMLWPEQSEQRAHFVAVESVRRLVNGCDSSAVVAVPVAKLDALLRASSGDQVDEAVQQAARRGIVAGYVFTAMFLMEQIGGLNPKRGATGASLSKAQYVAMQWGSEHTFGDGSAAWKSKKSVKDIWRDYRSVAHLWAAREWNRMPWGSLIPAGDELRAEHLGTLLRSAAYLQKFGLCHMLDIKSKRSQEPLLDPESAWLVDVRQHRPSIMLPIDWGVFEKAPFIVALRTYKADLPRKQTG